MTDLNFKSSKVFRVPYVENRLSMQRQSIFDSLLFSTMHSGCNKLKNEVGNSKSIGLNVYFLTWKSSIKTNEILELDKTIIPFNIEE